MYNVHCTIIPNYDIQNYHLCRFVIEETLGHLTKLTNQLKCNKYPKVVMPTNKKALSSKI